MEQYINKSALVAELERIEHETNYEPFTSEVLGKRCACKGLLSFLDTLKVKEVQEEPVSEDLEDAANDYAHNLLHDDVFETFIVGAQWQKEQMLNNLKNE